MQKLPIADRESETYEVFIQDADGVPSNTEEWDT